MVILVYREQATTRLEPGRRDVMKIVSAAGARSHHGTYVIGQPEAALDGARAALAEVVPFRHEKWNIRRQAVVFPGLNHVVHEVRLPVERTPVAAHARTHAGIMLKREEREILQVDRGL